MTQTLSGLMHFVRKLYFCTVQHIIVGYTAICTTKFEDTSIVNGKAWKCELNCTFVHSIKSKQKAWSQAKEWKFSCLNFWIYK